MASLARPVGGEPSMATRNYHEIRENLMLALDTLRTHKFRAFLTILGC